MLVSLAHSPPIIAEVRLVNRTIGDEIETRHRVVAQNDRTRSMRLTPAQIGVELIFVKRLSQFAEATFGGEATMAQRIRRGHDLLVSMSGKDFGYDLVAWHQYLKESRDGGYTYGRNIILPRIMESALASKGWRDAVAEIQAEGAL
jgi:hypothetical protein